MRKSNSIAIKAYAPSSAYLFRIGGKQALGSGNPKDLSGNGRHAVIGAANTDALSWANPGDMTTTALGSTDGGFTIPGLGAAGAVPYEANSGQSLIMFGEFSCTTTGVAVMGNLTASAGISLGATSGLNAQSVAGGFKLSMQDVAGHTFTTGALDRVNTGAKIPFFVDLNGSNKLARVWLAGKEQTGLTGGGDLSAITASVYSPFPWGFGHNGSPGTSGTSATKQRNMCALLLQPGVRPPDIVALARFFFACPDIPLPASLVGV